MSQDMSLQMVDFNQGNISGQGESFGKGDSDEQ